MVVAEWALLFVMLTWLSTHRSGRDMMFCRRSLPKQPTFNRELPSVKENCGAVCDFNKTPYGPHTDFVCVYWAMNLTADRCAGVTNKSLFQSLGKASATEFRTEMCRIN